MTTRLLRRHLAVLAVAAAAWAICPGAQAQNSNSGGISIPPPVVTIAAMDSVASENGDNPGTFLIRRDGHTNTSLLVFFTLGGTATNGVDYETLPHLIMIPAGAFGAHLVVKPIDDALVEGDETVVVQIIPSLLMGPLEQYRIGIPSNAVVVITDDDHIPPDNRPPFVRLNWPASGEVFDAPANIFLAAYADDAEDGHDLTVEFFADDRSLGRGTFVPTLCPSPYCPFFALTWSNAPPGSHTLTAKAMDKKGAITVSAPVSILVRGHPIQPVVNIVATDPHAAEIPVVPPGMGMPQRIDMAVFTVTRSGDLSIPLDVFYSVGGTAINGVDYERLSGRVTIPANAASAIIEVVPIDDFLVEGTETVVITIQPPVCITIFPPPPSCYLVGPSNRAVAEIADNDTEPVNLPPQVHITQPANGQIFRAPANVTIAVDTVDADGYVGRVEFYEGGRKIGEDYKLFLVPPPPGTHIPYEFTWTNVPAGHYVLTAKAFDDQAAATVSMPVTILVVETSLPPVVNIAAPDPYASEGLVVWLGNTVLGTSAWGTNQWWHTNRWGTNTATFKVRRHGETNADLTVSYAISGTASNGVDYETLPGRVTIPAGRRAATITIVPIDDTVPERIETVVLTLVPPSPPASGANAEPPYRIGRFHRAAAIIVDNDLPRPPCLSLSDRLFHFIRPGTNGLWHRIEVSTNLVHWTPVSTNVVTDGATQFVDPDAASAPVRFYRAVPEEDPPED